MKVLDQLLRDAPNLLPRVSRLASGFFAARLHRPVLLIGCGRSGKTVLSELLGRHPAIALYPGEANFIWHPRLYPWRHSPERTNVPPIWADPEGFARGTITQRTRKDTRTLRATFGLYQFLRRRPLLLNESALTAVMLSYLLEHFPDAAFLHMFRDGRAVASAWARRQHATILAEPLPYRAAGLEIGFDDVLVRCAQSWAWQVEHVCRLRAEGVLDQSKFIDIRYENFCAKPAETVDLILDGLGLDRNPLRQIDLGFIENRNAQETSSLTRRQTRAVEEAVAPTLRRLGYEVGLR